MGKRDLGKIKKTKKAILLLLFLAFFGCTSWFESLNDSIEMHPQTMIRLIVSSSIISTYKFIYDKFPDNISNLDSFIISKDFPCYRKQDHFNISQYSLVSDIKLLDSNDSLQQLKIYLKPFIVGNSVARGCSGVVSLYVSKADSSFDVTIDSITVNNIAAQIEKLEESDKFTFSIIKCN